MTTRFLHPLLFILTSTLPVSVCLADAPATPREFEIELLVFQNLVANDGGEIWPVDYSTWFEDTDEERANTDPATAEINWLPKNAWRLIAERNALSRSSQYRPIAYFAWRQAVLDRSQAVSMQLPGKDNHTGNTYVDGSVRVAVERYLHLYMDLQLHTPVNSEQLELLDYDIPEFRLTEHRRMRSKEIHYFDNPRFGVIALITAYEPPQQQTSSAAAELSQPQKTGAKPGP
ncbi:MAG: CsiV family protein [Gammaproteobacteria bacterium]|nr:MAG: CsiV family protein [Gammaproteobacteria bacterium]